MAAARSSADRLGTRLRLAEVGKLNINLRHLNARMKMLLSLAAVVVTLPLSSLAQDVEPLPAPPDVVLEFSTEGDQQQFHLGELIPVRFSYIARTDGKYAVVSMRESIAGNRTVQVSCSPEAEKISARRFSPDITPLEQILLAPCGGSGGGSGWGCSDCDGELTLTTEKRVSESSPLNSHIHFRVGGTYTCEAESTEVTTTRREQEPPPTLLVKSNPITLNMVDDPAWSHSAVANYTGAYDENCRGDDVAEKRPLQCFDIARRITYLDTVESLRAEVIRFDGRVRGWDNGFWEAIRHSSYPEEAVRLMTSRMQEPDFQVTVEVLERLASAELRIEAPEAFQTNAPANYHGQAVEKLRKYVRLLGESLHSKNSDVLRKARRPSDTLRSKTTVKGTRLFQQTSRISCCRKSVSSRRHCLPAVRR